MPRDKETPSAVAAGEGAEGKQSSRGDRDGLNDTTPISLSSTQTAAEFLAEYERQKAEKLSRPRPKRPPVVPIGRSLRYREGKRIHIYHGRGEIMETVTKHCPNPEGKGGGKRSKILTWSKSSRNRARHVLLSCSCPEGWATYGVTLTIPGPVATIEEQRELWSRYCLDVAKYGWLMVWRLEVQARGAWHWHCLLSMPEYGGADLPAPWKGITDNCTAITVSWWRIALDRMPAVEGHTDKGAWVGMTPRSGWPGALKHAVDVTTEGATRGAWLRYLADHATKAKQGQVGVNVGRHWGVVGRKWLCKLVPDSVEVLTDRQSWAYLRAKQRLATPRIPCESAPFGRRLGYRIRRGTVGRSVWFCNTATALRLIAWARSLYPGQNEGVN